MDKYSELHSFATVFLLLFGYGWGAVRASLAALTERRALLNKMRRSLMLSVVSSSLSLRRLCHCVSLILVSLSSLSLSQHGHAMEVRLTYVCRSAHPSYEGTGVRHTVARATGATRATKELLLHEQLPSSSSRGGGA